MPFVEHGIGLPAPNRDDRSSYWRAPTIYVSRLHPSISEFPYESHRHRALDRSPAGESECLQGIFLSDTWTNHWRQTTTEPIRSITRLTPTTPSTAPRTEWPIASENASVRVRIAMTGTWITEVDSGPNGLATDIQRLPIYTSQETHNP